MADTLFGTGVPQFIVWFIIRVMGWRFRFPNIISLPHPSIPMEEFPPDDIPYSYHSGKKDAQYRGVYLYWELYWDKLTYAQTLQMYQLVQLSRETEVWFKPHSDYSKSFKVTINELEGWNFNFVMNKYTNGYEGKLIIRGTERLDTLPEPKPTTPNNPGYHKITTYTDIPSGAIV